MRTLLWGTIGYVVLLLAGTAELMRRMVKLDSAYQDKMDLAGTADDDDCWLWGMIYYNPRDRKTVVEKRVGVGTTINMATPAGKVMGIFLAAVLLGMLLICVWTIRLEFTPIRLTIQGNTLTAEQLREDYAIPLENIEEVTLVQELPDMTRTNGTAMGNLSKGEIPHPGDRRELPGISGSAQYGVPLFPRRRRALLHERRHRSGRRWRSTPA